MLNDYNSHSNLLFVKLRLYVFVLETDTPHGFIVPKCRIDGTFHPLQQYTKVAWFYGGLKFFLSLSGRHANMLKNLTYKIA
jgi:hypothetical protein